MSRCRSRWVASLVAQVPSWPVSGIGVEGPEQLAVVGVERLDEAADAVLAAVGADQHLAVDGDRRHRLRVAGFRVGDLRRPQHLAGLGVEREQLGVERSHVEPVAHDGDAAVVRAAAEGRDRTHLVLVVPELLAGRGVERVQVVVRGRDVHDAVDDDRRRLHRLEHLGLELERRPQLGDVGGVDLRRRVVPGLRVAHVRVQEVGAVLVGGVELGLRHRDALRHRRAGGRGAARDLGLGERRRTQRRRARRK